MNDIHSVDPNNPAAMAAFFAQRTQELLREGRPVASVARLAASYGFLANPWLREPDDRVRARTLSEFYFRLGCELNAVHADRARMKGQVIH